MYDLIGLPPTRAAPFVKDVDRKAIAMAAQQRRTHTRIFATATALAGIAALAGCAGGTAAVEGEYGFASVEQEADSTITVWVDAAREPIAKAFVPFRLTCSATLVR